MMTKTVALTAFCALSAVVFAGSPAELEKAFDDAYKAGEPLKADQAFRTLVEKNPKTAPIRYYQAAEVSRMLGKTTDRRTRLSHYLKVEKAWSDTAEQAAWEMCLTAANADEFALLCSKVKPSRTLLSAGLRLLDTYRSQKRSSDFKKVASTMFSAFKSDDDREAIQSRIAGMLVDGIPGFTADDARGFIDRYPSKNLGNLDWMLRVKRDSFSPIWRLRHMAKVGGVLTPEPFDWAVNIDYKSEEECAEAVKAVKAIQPLVLDGKHPSQAYNWYRLRLNLADRFFNKDQAAQQSADLAALFEKVSMTEPKQDTGLMRNLAVWTIQSGRWTPADCTRLVAKFPQYFPASNIWGSGGLTEACDKAKSAAPFAAWFAKNPTRTDVRWEGLRTLARNGGVNEVKAGFEYAILNDWSGRLDVWHLFGALTECKGFTDADRVEFMKSVYAKSGAHQFWSFLHDDKRANGAPAMTNAAAKAFIASIRNDAKSKERIVEIRREMAALRRGANNIAPDAAHKLFEEACKVFPGFYPQSQRWDNGIFGQLMWNYIDLSQHNLTSCPIAAKAITAKLDPKNADVWRGIANNNYLFWNSRDSKEGVYNQIYIARAQATKDAGNILGLRFPKDTAKLPDGIDVLTVGDKGAIINFIQLNWAYNDGNQRYFTPELAGALLSGWFAKNDVRKIDANVAGTAFALVRALGEAKKEVLAQFPFDKVAAELLDADIGRPDLARMFLSACQAAGRGKPYLDRYVNGVAKFEPVVKLNTLIRLAEMEDVVHLGNAEKKIEDRFAPIFKDRVLPALKAVSSRQAALVDLGSYGALSRRAYAYRDAYKDDAAVKKAVDEFFLENIRLKNGGAIGWTDDWGRGGSYYYCHAYELALATTNAVRMADVAQQTGARMNPWTIGWDRMNAIIDKTYKAGQWESLYLIVSSLGDYDKGLTSKAARLRGEAATHLPGVYPVPERDPLYPLYVAADEFNRNNYERATSLLKKSLTVFERDCAKLPPDFVAWAVEQLRLERGKKDDMLLKARTIATQLLQDESKITPELAAAMMLVRAECYRDQQNFEAAKLEYQTIRNSPVYSKTKSGRKAMYRAIDLMIDTGNASGCESTLEYWLSQPDPEVQAQAHYFLARIAFEHKDYEETRKQLKEVFSINFTHTEGRFLEGKWKLATGNEVDDTEVMIGKLADRTVIRPGQQLSISVQDRNLSVAGGGASIPVVVTTKPGNDRERIYLYPSPRDPTLFKGVIDVRLGKTVCSNLTLEVTGQDSASYVIDPEYLKARGLPLNTSKNLRVVDDGRLAIGAGAPRTDESETRSQLEAIVASGGSDEGRFRPALRPGNPLYIAVMDKDRSLGGEDGEINVAVSTTSGDRLENVALKEVEPYSGIFRGEVKTSLPPPRAFASDTAVGFNPGDIINSTRDGEWKSLSDGQPGKWFAVDTMASHLVSNVVIKMNAPEELRSIRLSGTLGKENYVLGTFPAGKAENRTGLRMQEEWNIHARDEASIVSYFERPGAQKVQMVTNIAQRMKAYNGNVLTRYYTGAFCAPEGFDYLRLRLAPATTIGDTFKSLWFSLRIDGKPVMTGTGAGLVNQIVTTGITPGAHRITVFTTARGDDDSWQLLWEPVGEEASPFPIEWFDAKKHPEILDFLSDRAVITRTKEGFEAVFRTPVRLRTIRFDFLDRTGPDVQLTSFAATDSAGKAILPVETDFSDAQKNELLEVAPGDTISVTYADESNSVGERRVLTKTIRSSFNDASVGFYFEEVEVSRQGSQSTLHSAYRFVPGDTLLIGVQDPDLDLTEEADTVKVNIRTQSGITMEVPLVEQSKYYGGVTMPRMEDMDGVHSGFFLGLLKTCPETTTNANKKVLRCSPTETLYLSYEDRENTNPGVPFVRTAMVNATKSVDPMITLFHTRVNRIEDTSADAKAKLNMIRRRAGNEKVEKLYTEQVVAIPMNRSTCNSTNLIPVNVAAPLPVRVNDPARARHDASCLKLEAWTKAEEDRAAADGDEVQKQVLTLRLANAFTGVSLRKGGESDLEARAAGSFNGVLRFAVGGLDSNVDSTWTDAANRPVILPVTGSDTVYLRVCDPDGTELISRKLSLVSNASLGLMDSTWNAERNAAHVGERFFVRVEDPDRDATDEADSVEVAVRTTGGTSRRMVLSETLPHSGIFTGVIRPVIFPPTEKIPGVVTGATATVEQLLAEDRLSVKYGESVLFSYRDENVLPGTKPRTLCTTGMVHKGANGDVRLFSKRFRDMDAAVLVQFRLAECLFEQAKDHRKLKHAEKSAEAIAKGRNILEEALKNNPDSAHVAQGEFLLANLYQELAAEEKQNGDKAKAKLLYAEALARFSSILAVWPDGNYAARSQYHKAYCLEMLGDYKLAGEEYVKMTYMYPESELVGDATIRLATYYYRQEKKYETAARIYENFARRFPQHDKAPRALFMCGSCFVKEGDRIINEIIEAEKAAAERENREPRLNQRGCPPGASDMFQKAVDAFVTMGDKYRATTTPELRAQALYWAGDASFRREDMKNAYIFFKRTVLEYPETEWARRARGMLLQNGRAFQNVDS